MAKNKIIFSLIFFIMFLLLISPSFICFKNNFLQKTAMAKHDEGGGEGAKSIEEIEKEKEEQERKMAEEFWEVDYPWNPPKPNLPHYINYIYQFSLWVGSFLAVLMIIIGGIEWSSSASNPQKKMEAKKKITNSIMGLVAFFSIFVVLKTINPDILILKEIKVKEATPSGQGGDQEPPQETKEAEAIKKGQFYYPINGADIGYEIARNADGLKIDGTKEHFAKAVGEYTQEDYKAHPFFWKGMNGADICFYGCKYYQAGSPQVSSPEELRSLSPRIYGVITKEGACKCYQTIDEKNTTPVVGTFALKDACECAGEEKPLCWSDDHEFCTEYCKRGLNFSYKFGYIAGCDAGSGKDDILCACVQ